MKPIAVIIIITVLYACGSSSGGAPGGGAGDSRPRVTDVEPELNAISAMTGVTIMAQFDRPMQSPTAGTFVVFGAQTGRLSGTFAGGGSDTLVFDADNAFNVGEEIEVVLTNSLTSTDGTFLPEPFVYRFRAETMSGSANFADADTIVDQVDTLALTAGDWDGDGDLDLAAANFGNDVVKALENE